MEGRRALCLALMASAAIVSVWSSCEAAVSVQQPPATATATPGPDTNVLCVSKCGTCPTVCSSPPPAPPSSSAGDNSVTPPPPPGQGKGDRPSNYYYFFTAAASRRSSCAGAGVYAVVVLALVSAVGNLR
nr:unnamed protein product [Digitaria exilis]